MPEDFEEKRLKMKKKLIVLVIIILGVIFLIAGCSGGGSDSSSQGKDAASQEQSTSPAAGESADSQASPSPSTASPAGTPAAGKGKTAPPPKLEVPRKFQYEKGKLPKKIEYLLDNGVPVVVSFFDSKDTLSLNIKPKISNIITQYNTSQIRYFAFTSTESQEQTKLSMALGVRYLPYVGIIDRDKNIVFEKNGFIDINYLNNAIYRVVYRDLGQK